ncbi:monovalent cation/H+ antiporter subunit D [Novosphingobium endophyticum]|uniref:Monovalent cation/H+ antiporter subunit D n=2 Tax=Novosphingobium endophyticum TaxID=1955250 RepID=A0A916TU09_9SPHN|nr:monovalent cation/H+ antiporter subunit D [Novosphingobium endophyticum]
MMDALIAAPLLLPAFAGTASLLFWLRYRWIGAIISIASMMGLIALAIVLMAQAASGGAIAYALGDWPAPFGIVLVLDRLSALMLLLTALLGFAVAVHAALTGLDRKGWHFHPLLQFQLLGINGAFLTGDLFNLFVFFEVLLIASYGLMLHGQGAQRLSAGIQYVIVNLLGSTLFLIALGLLYGVTGTLNMADMAVRAGALPEGDQGLLRAGGLLLAVVFALKAALLPLHLWLPRTYAATAPAVATLFAIMTKVGAYAIIRTMPLIFGDAAGTFLLPSALGTMLLGFFGLLAARGLADMAAFGLIGSTATLLTAIALFDGHAMAAALYYLPHTTLTAALLFLTVDLIIRWRGVEGGAIVPTPHYKGQGWLGFQFLAAAVALVGLPPLSGFVGKLLILQAAIPSAYMVAIWAFVLGTSLLGLIGLARAGSTLFWKEDANPAIAADRPAPRALEALPAAFLLILLAALTAGAGPATAYMEATSAQVFDATGYVRSVLGPEQGGAGR